MPISAKYHPISNWYFDLSIPQRLNLTVCMLLLLLLNMVLRFIQIDLSVVHPFVLLSRITFYEYISIFLSLFLLMDIYWYDHIFFPFILLIWQSALIAFLKSKCTFLKQILHSHNVLVCWWIPFADIFLRTFISILMKAICELFLIMASQVLVSEFVCPYKSIESLLMLKVQ